MKRLRGRTCGQVLAVGQLVALSVAGSSTAFAQDADPSAETAAQGGIAEIVVTAQRREEKLQNVPIAVTAVPAEQLQLANVTSALDVGKIASGIVFQQSTGTATTFIRGMGNNQLTVGNEASNSLYIDGVYYARISPVLMRFENVDRIEILKGPQGTLFGRNATGGLINIVTSTPQPGAAPELKATVGYGRYDSTEASLFGSTTLTDRSAINVNLLYTDQSDGWGENILNGKDTYTERNLAARAKYVFEMSDATKFTLEADVNDSNSSIGLLNNFVGDDPAPAGFGDGSGYLPELSSRYDKNSNLEDIANTKGYGGYARLEQELSWANLVATAAMHNERITYHNDIDKTPLTYFHFEEDDTKADQYSGELQLFSKNSEGLTWTAGAFYLKQDYGFPKAAKIYGDSFGPGVTVLVGDSGETTSYALYAQTSFDILPRLRGTLGGRINRDKLVGRGLTDIQIAGVGLIPGVPQREEETYDKFTYRAALDFKATDDVLLYASISRGTKAGLFNLVTFDPVAIDPEVLDAYEIGFKSELLDRRMRLNGAVFYYDYKNPQVQTQQPNGVTRLSNAKAARIRGAELEAEIAATDTLSVRASATYLDGEYTDYEDAPFYTANPNLPYGLLPAVTGDATGNQLSRAPEFSGTLGVNQRIPLSAGELNVALNYAYTGSFYWNPDNLIKQDAYGLFDANIGYTFPSETITVQVWGSNLTNEVYNLTENEFAGPVGTSSGPGAPRMYGVRLRWTFQ